MQYNTIQDTTLHYNTTLYYTIICPARRWRASGSTACGLRVGRKGLREDPQEDPKRTTKVIARWFSR